MDARRLLTAAGLAGGLALLAGCGGPPGGPAQAQALAEAAGDLAAAVGQAASGPVAWAGFRTSEGGSTAATAVLDEEVASALIQRGVSLVPVDTLGGATWNGPDPVPSSLWREAPAPCVLAGRVETAGSWAYLRLFLVEAQTGRLLRQTTRRLAARHLQTVAGAGGQEAAGQTGAVELEVHRVGLRAEGGVTHSIEIGPQGSLLPGDRMHLRFRAARDCQVWILLFLSTGERKELFAAQPVYSGRWNYIPSQDDGVALDQSGEVYTLYVVAAAKLSPDLGSDDNDLWRRTGEMVQRGQLNHYAGLEQVDQALADYAVVRAPAAPGPLVLRDAAEVTLGEEEELVLGGGLRVNSRPEVLRAPYGVVRAVSFELR